MHERRSDLHQQPDLRLTDREYRVFSDDELARWRAFWERRIALLREEEPDPALRESTGGYCAVQLGMIEREEAARRRAALLGVGRQESRYSEVRLRDLKRGVRLDLLLEEELGAVLRQPNRRGVRRGWCPLCKPSPDSNALAVYIADADDQHFRCFRCGAAGDVIAAMQIIHQESFAEAVARLAREQKVTSPTKPTRPGARRVGFEYRDGVVHR